ncbi:MAG: hypothetical protein LBU47_06845 [Christensenellaceae bacterium]|nr:hypothetical protein [Christensenellaceae bacterium]
MRNEKLKACGLSLLGLVLLFLPFPLLRWIGVLLLALGLVVCLALFFRAKKAREILKEEVLRFEGGVICKRGILAGGEILDISALGTSLTGLELTENALVFEYRFIAKGNRRQKERFSLPILPKEREKAAEALNYFGLPAKAEAGNAPQEEGQNTPQEGGGNDDGT